MTEVVLTSQSKGFQETLNIGQETGIDVVLVPADRSVGDCFPRGYRDTRAPIPAFPCTMPSSYAAKSFPRQYLSERLPAVYLTMPGRYDACITNT
jgi:hypothetical protein